MDMTRLMTALQGDRTGDLGYAAWMLEGRDNTAVVPDRLRRSGLAGEPTVLDGVNIPVLVAP